MSNSRPTVTLTGRDRQTLRLLSWTPVTAALLVKASATFAACDDFPPSFSDAGSVRERMRKLEAANLVRSWPLPLATGGRQMNYYKLTHDGFRVVHGADAALPNRAFFQELAPSNAQHAYDIAQAVVHTITAAHHAGIRIRRHYRENEVEITGGGLKKRPDAIVQLDMAGLGFAHLYEIDEHTETVDSWRTDTDTITGKIRCYEAYQQQLLAQWARGGRVGRRPRFRVVFFTHSLQRAMHIAQQAHSLALDRRRVLVYAAPLQSFLQEPDALRCPLFLDRHGHWQAMTNASFAAHWVHPQPQLWSSVAQSSSAW